MQGQLMPMTEVKSEVVTPTDKKTKSNPLTYKHYVCLDFFRFVQFVCFFSAILPY